MTKAEKARVIDLLNVHYKHYVNYLTAYGVEDIRTRNQYAHYSGILAGANAAGMNLIVRDSSGEHTAI